MRKYLFLAVSAFALTALPALEAAAGGLDGTWLRPKNGHHIKSFACGGGLGLKVVETGAQLTCGAKSVGGGKFKGSLLNTDDGNTYSGTIAMGAKSLVLSGCVLGGLFCKSETWSRVN
jgi:uncharacterized protein (DUF2147 family)